ncbi:GNAT family N-acetyltransferase [Ekhidna sp.]|uniref:GNAT family N-acetyltransferase n=1 Tax=Ekhidna sp. TaxID=2608089 RepID=UPI0035165C93
MFQVSYVVEAKLLNAEDNFPPLKRPLSAFINTNTIFYGYHKNEKLVAVMEIKADAQSTHIQSLVVDPAFFRKGIAGKLLSFLFENFNSPLFTVETGAANDPAIALYERFGFKLVKKWMTEFGIEKVAFEKTNPPLLQTPPVC